MVLGHLGLNVDDLALARRYYDRLMPEVGFEAFPLHDESDQFAYRPAAGRRGTYLFFYAAAEPGGPAGYSHHRSGLQHLAFMVPTRAQVERVRDVAVELGSDIVHRPREFPEYPPPYYATFWHDPHGFLLEAVCHR